MMPSLPPEDAFGTLITLMYVSVSSIEPRNSDEIVSTIVRQSVANNAERDITGALIYTGTHFAQVLEGTAPEIDRLMVAIIGDPRHREVATVDRIPIVARRFPDWSMAYNGSATFVDRPIQHLLPRGGVHSAREKVYEIYAMMSEFMRP